MDINKRNRTELKSFFVKNAIPTESNFADLIEGVLNQKDDGIVKLPGNPLSIEASGDDSSLKKAITIFRNFNDANPAWTMNLNPRSDPNNAATAKAGFTVSDGDGNNRFFIDRATGNVGLGTITPTCPLTIQAGGAAYLNLKASNGDLEVLLGADTTGGIVSTMTNHDLQLRAGGNNTKMVIKANGNVGIGTTTPGAKLEITASTATHGGWLEAIRFSRPEHSAITLPAAGLLFGLHSDRNFYFADIKDGFKKYVMSINAETGKVVVANGSFSVQNAGSEFAYSGHADIVLRATGRGSGGRAIVHDGGNTLTLNFGGDFTGGVQHHGALRQVSSREFKDNIQALATQEALTILHGLNPVKFHFKADEEQKVNLGFIAEDVPPLIASDDHKAITPAHIITVLTSVVKEHQRLLETLVENRKVKQATGAEV